MRRLNVFRAILGCLRAFLESVGYDDRLEQWKQTKFKRFGDFTAALVSVYEQIDTFLKSFFFGGGGGVS